jgi:uncharacterized membrane protein YcaP (DUF421 family)
MEQVFFNDWGSLARTATVGVLAYVGLVVLLRIAGNRTLSKMNAFDFVVTVALGSTLATILLSKDVSLAQGVLALLLLIAMQFIVSWSSVRMSWVRQLVTGEPTLLFFGGAMLHDGLRRARVTEDEVRAAVRTAGIAAMDEVEAVVMETDGSLSVVRQSAVSSHADESSLRDLKTLKRSRTADGQTKPAHP